MNLNDTPQAVRGEWLFVYERIAGWRWEHLLGGVLVSKSRESFETRADCLADAREHGWEGTFSAPESACDQDEATLAAV